MPSNSYTSLYSYSLSRVILFINFHPFLLWWFYKNNENHTILNAKNIIQYNTEYINKDNIREYITILDRNKWKVDEAYMLYNKEDYPYEFDNESNYIFLLKENRYLLIEYNPYIEFNDEQINVLNQLIERSNEVFVEEH